MAPVTLLQGPPGRGAPQISSAQLEEALRGEIRRLVFHEVCHSAPVSAAAAASASSPSASSSSGCAAPCALPRSAGRSGSAGGDAAVAKALVRRAHAAWDELSTLQGGPAAEEEEVEGVAELRAAAMARLSRLVELSQALAHEQSLQEHARELCMREHVYLDYYFSQLPGGVAAGDDSGEASASGSSSWLGFSATAPVGEVGGLGDVYLEQIRAMTRAVEHCRKEASSAALVCRREEELDFLRKQLEDTNKTRAETKTWQAKDIARLHRAIVATGAALLPSDFPIQPLEPKPSVSRPGSSRGPRGRGAGGMQKRRKSIPAAWINGRAGPAVAQAYPPATASASTSLSVQTSGLRSPRRTAASAVAGPPGARAGASRSCCPSPLGPRPMWDDSVGCYSAPCSPVPGSTRSTTADSRPVDNYSRLYTSAPMPGACSSPTSSVPPLPARAATSLGFRPKGAAAETERGDTPGGVGGDAHFGANGGRGKPVAVSALPPRVGSFAFSGWSPQQGMH